MDLRAERDGQTVGEPTHGGPFWGAGDRRRGLGRRIVRERRRERIDVPFERRTGADRRRGRRRANTPRDASPDGVRLLDG